jgi:hypothetical protein
MMFNLTANLIKLHPIKLIPSIAINRNGTIQGLMAPGRNAAEAIRINLYLVEGRIMGRKDCMIPLRRLQQLRIKQRT